MLGGDMSAGSMRAAIIILLLLLALALLSHRNQNSHTDRFAAAHAPLIDVSIASV
jgi:hypothetical protein